MDVAIYENGVGESTLEMPRPVVLGGAYRWMELPDTFSLSFYIYYI
jgi:hypothetical protein